jgi:hypothetical protein
MDCALGFGAAILRHGVFCGNITLLGECETNLHEAAGACLIYHRVTSIFISRVAVVVVRPIIDSGTAKYVRHSAEC